jgi:hypothetical protein
LERPEAKAAAFGPRAEFPESSGWKGATRKEEFSAGRFLASGPRDEQPEVTAAGEISHSRGESMKDEKNEGSPRSGVVHRDQRKAPRVSINLPIGLFRTNAAGDSIGRTADASEGGLMLCLSEPIGIGEQLSLKIYSASSFDVGAIESLVEVVWRVDQAESDGDYRTGVKFVEISRMDRERLRELLEKS